MTCGTMRVGDVMRTDVPTITPEATVADALRSARRRGIRHVVVLDRGVVVGILSDRDLKRVLGADSADAGARAAPATDVMTRTVVTVSPDATVKMACDTMMQEGVSALPVLDRGALVGIITESDVLTLFAKSG